MYVSVLMYNLLGLSNTKSILLEERWWYYLTHSREDRLFHAFPKVICSKVNVIALLEFELAYYDSAVQRFNHYTTGTSPVHLCMHICVSICAYEHMHISLCVHPCACAYIHLCVCVCVCVCACVCMCLHLHVGPSISFQTFFFCTGI